MTAKASFVSLLVCGLLVAALVSRNGGMLLLAVPFMLYLILGVLACPPLMSLRAQRTLAQVEVAAGEPLPVRVQIENHGPPLVNLSLTDLCHPDLKIEGRVHQRLALAAGGCVELDYVVTAPRGLYAWEAVQARASDPFALFELRRLLPCMSEVRVRPAPLKIRPVPFRPRQTLHAPGPSLARLAGTGTDFWGVREYRPGDPPRRLNWRLAGRYPRRMFTNQFQGEEIADFGLIVDARTLTDAPAAEGQAFEASVRAAAALAEVILNQGNRLALLVFGENTSCLFPGYGKRQLSFVVQNLCTARLGRNLSLRYLEYFPTRVFPAQSIIVVFSMLDGRDTDTYVRLRSYGYDVALISPSPVELMARGMPHDRLSDWAVRAARLERRSQLQTLLGMGVEVIDWDIEQPLDPMLQTAARALTRRRNL